MGKKFSEVQKVSREGKESYKKGGELGKKAVMDTKSMKRLIDSLPSDVDDEIADAAKAVEQGTKTDAENYMNSEVKTQIESGNKSMEASTKQANEQVANNEKVMRIFEQMDNVGNFGSNARGEGNERIKMSTKEFSRVIHENNESARQADEELKRSLSEIASTF